MMPHSARRDDRPTPGTGAARGASPTSLAGIIP